MGKLRNSIIALFLIALIALAVIIYVVPGVTGMLVETYNAKYGELEIYDDTVVYFVRDEDVYGAEQTGDVNRLATEGELLRPYTAVVEVTGTYSESEGNSGEGGAETQEESGDRLTEIKNNLGSAMKTGMSYRLETGGIVSFFVDGYEKTLLPENIESFTKSSLEEIKQSSVVDCGLKVKKDYPVFKVINNVGWRLVAYIPKTHEDDYYEGKEVDVTFFQRKEDSDGEFPDLSKADPLENKVTMIVETKKYEGDYIKLVLKSSRFFGGIGQYRVCNGRIVSQDVRGILIENGSISNENGVHGVYVKNKIGKYDFVPILIYGSNDTTTVIADTYFYNENGEYTKTVSPFEDILRNPEAGKEDN